MDASTASSSSYVHQRGQSSLGSAGSGMARTRMAYPPAGGPAIASPPFAAHRYASGSVPIPFGGDGKPPMNGSAMNGVAMANGAGPYPAGPGGYAAGMPPSAQPMDPNGFAGPISPPFAQSPPANAQYVNGKSVRGSNPDPNAAPLQRSRSRRPDTLEIKRVARVHYEELFRFLKSHLAKGQRGPRTNAREKLTRLSQQQFTELSTDVYDELMRRVTNARTGSEIPHLAVREEFHPKRNQARQKLATLPRTRFKDLSSDVFFELERRFPELREEFRPEVSERERREEEEAAQRQRQRQNSILSNRDEDVGSSTVMPSQHEDEDEIRNDRAAQPSTSDVVIPAKSTLVEEQIAVPYAQPTESEDTDLVGGASSSYDKEVSSNSADGERATSIRDSIVTTDHDNNRSTMYSQASSVGTGFFNGYAGSRATESVASPNPANSSHAEGISLATEEKLRSEYEFRIATLQQKVTTLEARNTELEKEHDERMEQIKSELESTHETHKGQRRVLEESIEAEKSQHTLTHTRLQDTLSKVDELEERIRSAEQAKLAERTPAHVEEELENLKRDNAEQEELVAELRNEVTNLVEELRQLSTRNDEILSDKDSDQAVIRDLNNQVASYKRKYENAKTELRTLKATSQLFVQPPKTDDFMPPSETGAIADINLTAFQSSIDELLAAARSKTPSNVLLAMKTVVLAATLITDDVTKFEQRENAGGADGSGLDSDVREQLPQIKGRVSSTLNNLMTACRNHASSHGLSPVSLLDAASSHVSVAIVDIVKLVKVRKATKEEAEGFEATFTQHGTLPNGLKPLLGGSALANHNSPASDLRRRQPALGSTDEDQRSLLGTPSLEANGGQASLSNRSFSPRLRQGSTPFGRYSPVSYRGDITRKDSTGEGSWKSRGDRSRNASISSSSSQVQQSSSHDRSVTPAVPVISSALLRAASSSSAGQSKQTNGIATPPSALQASIDDEALTTKSPTASSATNSTRGSSKRENGAQLAPRNIDVAKARGALSPGASPSASSLLNTPPPPLPPSGSDLEGSSEAYWAELRNYIEVQTEAIVHCIQALLSSIREGAQGNQLHENLTQITTIVSSIIAISKDNIPRAAAAVAKQAAAVNGSMNDSVSASRAATASADGERILRELSEHCEKLIEMQAIGGTFDKLTKSNMASASYGVAKGLKALNGLLNVEDE